MGSPIEKILQDIERPLKFIKDAQFRKINAVKNLSGYIVGLCEKGLAIPAGGFHEKLEKLRSLFQDYDEVALEKKVEKIEVALGAFGPKEQAERVERFISLDHPSYEIKDLEKSYGELSKKVQYLKGVGPRMGEKLGKVGIESIYDLMNFFPSRYEDRSTISKVKELHEGIESVVAGEIVYLGVAFYKGLRRKTYEIQLQDETGRVRLKWFHFYMGTFEKLKQGMHLIVSGKPIKYREQFEIHHPDFEVYYGEKDTVSFGKIVPVYREIGGMYQKNIRKIMDNVVRQYSAMRLCLLPPTICKEHDFLPPWKSVFELHQPKKVPGEFEHLSLVRGLAFEELFFYCVALAKHKEKASLRPGISFARPTTLDQRLIEALPYELTNAQKRVLHTIKSDMAKPFAMNRLLQGDVGSGKTVVAAIAALTAIEHGYQAVFMAPTEILVDQHLKNFRKWLEPLGVSVASLSGKFSASEKKKIQEDVKAGKISFLVGTHAVLEPGIEFESLGIVVVDEQHRFGVRQRASLRNKGLDPDVLVMSATPIPRTLALTLFSDLDVSIIDEFPKGRKEIQTKVFSERDRTKAYEIIRACVKRGEQAFVVYPLVQASEKLDAKDATSMAEIFQKEIFPEYNVGLIHGQMNPTQKEEIMRDFIERRIDVLVSTTVIEVGIDVPNATCMLIEHPERFGLSQLHQLRGRIGRGDKESFCYMIAPQQISALAKKRLKIFSETLDGFTLAEHDLRLRGPGDLFGIMQSGMPQFRLAEFPRDMDLLESARVEAFKILEKDPGFLQKEHQHFPWVIENLWKHRLKMTEIG